jgi:hypothetical protein
MPTSSKKTASSKSARKQTPTPAVQVAVAPQAPLVRWYRGMRNRMHDFLQRRPHRSFRRTRRRDYVRSLQLPGYWAFTNIVRRQLATHKRLFTGLVMLYSVASALFVGLGSQTTYSQLSTTLHTTGGDLFAGSFGALSQAGLLLISGVSGTLSSGITAVQQVYATMFALLVWLTTVWLLRTILAGRTPRLRDGMYNAGAPIVASFFVCLLLVAQVLPIALAAVGYNAAATSGVLDSGVGAMLFWAVASLLTILSLYWITSTLLALVVVTLPGMYPMRAIRTAGDLVIGRRIRILLRLLWLGLMIVLAWTIIMIPLILLDGWLKNLLPTINWLPIIPVALLVMSCLTVVWAASYVYLLYRRIVDDDAAPA